MDTTTLGAPSEEARSWTETFLVGGLNNLLFERSALMEKAEASSAAGDFLSSNEAIADAMYLQSVYVDLLAILQKHAPPTPPPGIPQELLDVTEPVQ